MTLDRKRGRSRPQAKNTQVPKEFPQGLMKESCIYLNGEIKNSCRGTYKVMLDNGMYAICTASKMDHRRISLIVGDTVTAEIPALGLSPDGPIRGRIVWRSRSNRNE